MPNDKSLKPDDFPVEVEDEKLVTADGKPIAKAKTPAVAEDIADRLNEDDGLIWLVVRGEALRSLTAGRRPQKNPRN
jgi:hypothetical protein